jgi:polyphosphate kinase 2 (PPK2 family)
VLQREDENGESDIWPASLNTAMLSRPPRFDEGQIRKRELRMARREILDRIQKYVDPFRVTNGKRFRLNSVDPADTCGLQLGKGEAAELLARGTHWLAEEQDMLYAQDSWSLLLVFQAMDAAGKDGTIKHVMSGINPQGCQVFSFKQPSREDLDHDFMWRYLKSLPERGRIGIFNRSYYEEVLVVRVHPEVLRRQRLPAADVGKKSGISGSPTSPISKIT